MRLKFDTDTKYLVQIGDPLDHACASYIHNAMYELANLNAVNLNIVVKKGELSAFIEACKTLGFIGFDITTPHKTDIIPMCDEVDDLSREFNCVNHVKIRNGKLIGTGLDGLGMVMAIEAAGADISGSRVMMLGAGAVSGPIAAELCKRGAEHIVLLNRTVSKAKKIADTLRKHFPCVNTEHAAISSDNRNFFAPESDIVVQCTNLGRSDNTEDYDDLSFIDLLPETSYVADVLFNPERTSLLNRAEARGLHVLNGMGMLVNQEKAMIKFHFDIDMPDSFAEAGEEALLEALAMRQLRSKRLVTAQNKEVQNDR